MAYEGFRKPTIRRHQWRASQETDNESRSFKNPQANPPDLQPQAVASRKSSFTGKTSQTRRQPWAGRSAGSGLIIALEATTTNSTAEISEIHLAQMMPGSFKKHVIVHKVMACQNEQDRAVERRRRGEKCLGGQTADRAIKISFTAPSASDAKSDRNPAPEASRRRHPAKR